MWKRFFLVSLSSVGLNAVREYTEDSILYFGVHDDTFVHRWGIQEIAQHVFDPRTEAFPTNPNSIVKFDPQLVAKGDIVFARDIPRFMKELHPKIKEPYLLITAGDYKDKAESEHIDFLDDEKIIAWFCVHPFPRKHPKYHWLPLGIYQAEEFYKKREDLSSLFKRWRNIPKDKLLCSNFNLRPMFKPERNSIFDIFKAADFCDITEKKPFLEYMREMAEYKFTLSPRGLGPDCYRTWEALLVGSIPVLHSCYLDELYSDLPVLYVKDWTEVTPEFLELKYREISSKKYDIQKLFMNHWFNKIESVRDKFLRTMKVSSKPSSLTKK